MANKYYDNTTNIILPATSAEAADVENKCDDIVAGFELVEGDVGEAITLSHVDNTNRDIPDAFGVRANKMLGCDSSGEFGLQVRRGTFKGNWTPTTYFYQDDLIKDTTNALGEGVNSIFVAAVNHTSSASLATDVANWALIITTDDYVSLSYVDAADALKADITYVDAADALKADITYVDAADALKADITYVDNLAQAGKNLLINGDKSISQRGDFSTPFIGVLNEYYVDRYKFSTLASGDINYSHLPFNTTTLSHAIRCEAIDTLSVGLWYTRQSVENYQQLSGRELTYTAQVRSNRAFRLQAFDGTTEFQESFVGDSSWNTVSLTFTANASAGNSNFSVLSGESGESDEGYTIGDFIEVGNEQLEFGPRFTGFESVLPSTNLANCRRYFQPLTSTGTNDGIGLFMAISSTQYWCYKDITPMRTSSPSFTNGTIPLAFINSTSGTITELQIGPSSDATIGKINLQALGTGFTVDDMAFIKKNSDGSIIGLNAEI